jgi:hypothetical protein
MEIKIKLLIKDMKRTETLKKVRQLLLEYKSRLEKQSAKIRTNKYIYKMFNETYADKNAKEYFKGISHFHNLFEKELNTNDVFNETFYSRYNDRNNVDLVYLGNDSKYN